MYALRSLWRHSGSSSIASIMALAWAFSISSRPGTQSLPHMDARQAVQQAVQQAKQEQLVPLRIDLGGVGILRNWSRGFVAFA